MAASTQDALITFTDLPLEGFSDKAYNLVLMFEKPKFSARLAYNWRDDYLISQADCCIKLPIWQDAYGQLDASVHYKPSASWDIFLDAQNLTEAGDGAASAGERRRPAAAAFVVHERHAPAIGRSLSHPVNSRF